MTDLCSQEEITGRQTLNSTQMETINALLWETTEQVKKQQQRAHQAYINCHKLQDSWRPSRRSGKSSANANPNTHKPYAPEQPVTGPSSFIINHAMTGDEAFEEDMDTLGEDNDEANLGHVASHRGAQGSTVGKPLGKSV
ncbi:hypothetical protein M404DRAFT_36035 [Pisolithus tinctorius Marx 270]|uniref:Uncharacterized protein n=1 Tax=Pisolithus tinctorius Marx 270 TaxID=870435 RepID=A0A0C3J727_PISTI|nr:hypothetical protein M404DRAFT_36035 [Pisolithus tinctorius Marx 270]